MEVKGNIEIKQKQDEKVENTGKVLKEVTKNSEKTEEKQKEVENKVIENQVKTPIFMNEINYII
jgi:hypothetical protein